MECMFADCNSLTYLDLSNFNTQNVIYIDRMFLNCNSLKKGDIINYDDKILKELNKYNF